jgi:hypothetical protein
LLAVRVAFNILPLSSNDMFSLQHADKAQQAFSSDQISTLHLGIPALEALYKAWSTRAERDKYAPFAPALETACNKVDEYYEKTTESPAYIISMCMSCNSLLH